MKSYFWERDGICLRAFEKKDICQIKEMLVDTNYRMQADCGIGLAACEDDAEIFVESAKEETEDGAAIRLAVSNCYGECVGYCTMTELDERNGHANLFVTVFPKWQGNKIAQKAADILMRYAFFERRMHKLNCCVMEQNTAGQMFVKKLGFVKECVCADRFYTHGRYYDEYHYGILKEEYKTRTAMKPSKAAVTGGKDEKIKRQEILTEESLENLIHGLQKIPSVKQQSAYTDIREFWGYGGIRLRGMTENDWIKTHEMFYDSLACRFYDNDVKLPCDMNKLTDFELDHLQLSGEDGRIVFAVENRESDYVGTIQLAGMDEKNGSFSFSIYICKEAQNRGCGTKALFLVLSYAFFERRMHKCNTTVSAKNRASLKLMRKLGFEVEGIKRENVYSDGSYINDVFLGMTKAQFSRIHFSD